METRSVMKRKNYPKIGVVMVVQNDAETVEKAFRSFYDYAEAIVVSTDPARGWTGKAITADNTIDIIKSLDVDNKVTVIQDNFCVFDEPMENETFQRQMSADRLSDIVKDLDWICQIDADEEFLDFEQVLDFLDNVPFHCRGVRWSMAHIFNVLDDGRVLVVTDNDGVPYMHKFYFANRPRTYLVHARTPSIQPFGLNRQTLRLNEILVRSNKFTKFIQDFDGSKNPSGLCLHYTFAKSEKRVWEKLQTWGHSREFDIKAFFELWKRSKTDWENVRNFHFQVPEHWQRLHPFTIDELKSL